MRYITVSHLREGMELASYLYDDRLSVMLGPGVVLTNLQIERINDQGYAGVYVDDDFTRDIRPKDIIKEEIRLETIRSARDLLLDVERGGYEKGYNVSKVRQERIIMPVLEALIEAPVKLVDLVDLKPYGEYEYYHTANCVILSILLGLELGLSGSKLYDLGFAALLHDVGNLFIPKEILQKPGRLTSEEYDQVKLHTERGFEYMRRHFDVSVDACLGALHHHENYDGGGYPYGLKKNRISIYGRIIAITDVFDAMISRRPYRQPMFHSTAMEYLDSKAGALFDPEIVNAFHRVVAPYPSGFMVQLSTGVQGMVVENNTKDTSRPKVRLDKSYSKIPVTIDLLNNPAFRTVKVSHTVDA